MPNDPFAALIRQFIAKADADAGAGHAASPTGWHADLIEHWFDQLSQQRDLPLPLGSAVPAADRAGGDLLPLAPTPVQRAVLGLWALQHLPQLQVAPPSGSGAAPRVRALAGRHARQCAGSRDDFLLRHPLPSSLRHQPGHMNRQYVQALCRLAQVALDTMKGCAPDADMTGQPVDTAYLDNLVQRLNDMRHEDAARLEGDRRHIRARYLSAYGPEDLSPGGSSRQVAWQEVGPAAVATVRGQLAQPFGVWRLLTLLYCKLVAGLLGHARLPGRPSGADHVLRAVLRQLLHAAALPGDDPADRPLAPYAAGIDRVLGDAPWPEGAAWRPGPLPACFDHDVLGSHVGTLAQARCLLGRADLGGQADWANWVDRIGELAQDCASLVTDQHLAAVVGMRAEDFAALRTHLDAKLHMREIRRLERIAPDDEFRTFTLRPRMARLAGFHGWMADEGLAASQAAWQAATPVFAALAEADSAGEPMPCLLLPHGSCLHTALANGAGTTTSPTTPHTADTAAAMTGGLTNGL